MYLQGFVEDGLYLPENVERTYSNWMIKCHWSIELVELIYTNLIAHRYVGVIGMIRWYPPLFSSGCIIGVRLGLSGNSATALGHDPEGRKARRLRDLYHAIFSFIRFIFSPVFFASSTFVIKKKLSSMCDNRENFWKLSAVKPRTKPLNKNSFGARNDCFLI